MSSNNLAPKGVSWVWVPAAHTSPISGRESTALSGIKFSNSRGGHQLALVEIRDSRLYREDYETFEDYCLDRWEIHRRHAYRLIDSAEVVKQLECVHLDTKPANEAQVRPLTKLETPEAQQEACVVNPIIEKPQNSIVRHS